MTDQNIENVLAELKTSSKTSMSMVILGALCLLGSLYYSATRLTPLEKKISELTNAIGNLETQVKRKQTELDDLKPKLEQAEKQLDVSLASLNVLQEGTRSMLNRQYGDAIDSFNKYLEAFPDSAEALSFIGYAELRYAQYWRENSIRKGITADQRQQYVNATNQYSLLAENHLSRAAKLQQQYPWPKYNLSILYFQEGKKSEALSMLSAMLKETPGMVKWLCEDGQFRKMKIDKDTAAEFTQIVNATAKAEGKASCWVTKPVK